MIMKPLRADKIMSSLCFGGLYGPASLLRFCRATAVRRDSRNLSPLMYVRPPWIILMTGHLGRTSKGQLLHSFIKRERGDVTVHLDERTRAPSEDGTDGGNDVRATRTIKRSQVQFWSKERSRVNQLRCHLL